MSLVKKCQVCNKLEFILYKLNNDHHCPICTKKSINIDNLDNEYTYCYCNECNIAYRYNNKKKHHILHKYGNFYYAEVIEKYCTKGYNVNYMPMFKDEIYFKNLLYDETTTFDWKSYEKQDDCCVCFEKTTHTTECGHFLCEECIPNLKNNTCPMCRKELQYIVKQPDPDLYDDDNIY